MGVRSFVESLLAADDARYTVGFLLKFGVVEPLVSLVVLAAMLFVLDTVLQVPAVPSLPLVRERNVVAGAGFFVVYNLVSCNYVRYEE